MPVQPPVIAVFTKNRTNPAYAAARLGAERTAQRMGARVVHYVPHRPDDAGEQIELIDEALAARPAACALVPAHPTAVNAAIRKIHAAGVPIFGFVNPFTEPQYIVSCVGSDDYSLAFQMGSYVGRHFERRANIVLVEGPPESVSSIERLRGFRAALKQFPDMRIVNSMCGNYQRDDTLRAGQALLNSIGEFDAIMAANDVMALAVLETLSAADRTCIVTGINAVPEAIAAIKAGKLLATADFDAMKMGCLATEAAIRHLRGEAVPAQILLPVQIVDRANCAAWDKPFTERECPRWEDFVK